MGKEYGLLSIHAKIIDEYMREVSEPLGARHILDRLYGAFKRGSPTRRQVGIYLKLNPHYVLRENSSHGRLYSYNPQ